MLQTFAHRGGRLTCDATFKKWAWNGFLTLVSTVMFYWSACSNTIWLFKEHFLSYLVLSSFGFWHKCECVWSANWGLPSTCCKGGRAEIKGKHRGPAKVLLSPLLTLCGIGILAFIRALRVFLNSWAFPCPLWGLRNVRKELHSVNLKQSTCNNTEPQLF